MTTAMAQSRERWQALHVLSGVVMISPGKNDQKKTSISGDIEIHSGVIMKRSNLSPILE